MDELDLYLVGFLYTNTHTHTFGVFFCCFASNAFFARKPNEMCVYALCSAVHLPIAERIPLYIHELLLNETKTATPMQTSEISSIFHSTHLVLSLLLSHAVGLTGDGG